MCSIFWIEVSFYRRNMLAYLPHAFIFLLCIIVIWTISHPTGYPYKSQLKTFTQNRLEHGNYQVPIFENKKFCDIDDIYSPYKADFDCVLTKTSPQVHVCLHELWRDIYISHDLKETGKWEVHILKELQEVLRADNELGLIDVGANIGFYSMIAAKMGHKVVAVEPFAESRYRIHMAVQLEQLQNLITLVKNPVTNKRMKATVRTNGNNQGDVVIDISDIKPCLGACPEVVQTVILDDLLEVSNFSRAIIKIDAQGHEHRILQSGNNLFTHIDIPYIFVEWILMKQFYVNSNHTSLDKSLVELMIHNLFSMNYRPFQLNFDGSDPLNPDLWFDWPNDIVWRKMPNNVVKSKLLKNHYQLWPV